MEIKSQEEAKQSNENFAKEYLKILRQKKMLDDELKDIKNAYKEEGVPVNIVVKVLNKIKANKKKTEFERVEEDTIQEWLESNADIDNDIGLLTAK